MATLYDNYNTGDDGVTSTQTTAVWLAQTFTTTIPYIITSVKIKIYSISEPAVNLTIEIYAADGNHRPTGSVLVSGTIAKADIPISVLGPGTFVECTFSSSINLSASTEYAIVIRWASAPGVYVNWRQDSAPGDYTTGYYAVSTNTGSSWTNPDTRDHMFECYGSGIPPTDKTYTKKLIAIGNHEIWQESVAGTMTEFTDANADINTSNKLNVCVAFQKLFIVNEIKLKIADFGNTKIATTDINTHPPYRGTILTGGTSGAVMIVDYINASTADAACTVYGKRTTTATFSSGETVTGTNPSTTPSPYYSGASGAVTFIISAAETAPPHWYNWTVYGADATNFGIMPTNVYLVCNYMGSLVLSGDPNYPHQWYMSRQNNPFDFLYAQDDAQSAVAGNDTDAGEIGDIIKVNIPYKDDYIVHGCANTLWYMSGHPCTGGSINELDLTTGILGDRAFCWDDASNLYLMCTVGLLKIPPGFGQLENITIERWPDFIADLAFNASLHRITLVFNPEERGIHIYKVTLADGTSSSWWYDLRTDGLFPDSYSASHGVFSALYYQSEDPSYRKLLIGCNDGYIRFYDKTAENDDTTAIDSYVGFAPLALSTHPRKDGIIKNLDLVSGGGVSGGSQTDSDDVTCKVYVGRTAENILEQLSAGSTPRFTKTFTAPGFQRSNIDRREVRGQWGGIVLSNNTVNESWSMERLIVDSKEKGRSL